MEPECVLDIETVDGQPIIEEVIVPEGALSLEKVRKPKHAKSVDEQIEDIFAECDIQVEKPKKRKKVKLLKSNNKDDGDDDHDDDDDDEGDDNDGDDKGDDGCEDEDGDGEEEESPEDELVKTTRPANAFVASKNVAQGMMDIALITANANQLRYILAYNKGSSSYYINLLLVSASLILQISVGMCLILKGKYKKDSNPNIAKNLTSFIVIGVFLITIINVFIASFTITTEDTKA